MKYGIISVNLTKPIDTLLNPTFPDPYMSPVYEQVIRPMIVFRNRVRAYMNNLSDNVIFNEGALDFIWEENHEKLL